MNFDFSDEQKLLADQVQRFLHEQCSSQVTRQVIDDKLNYAVPVWQGLAQMGLLGTAVSDTYGGTGAGYLELCLVAQQLGAHLAPVPMGSTVYLTAEALLLFGSEAQKQQWLPGICDGSIKGALATVENMQQLTPQNISCKVQAGKLNGKKIVVADGGIADVLVVLALHDGQPALFLVEASALIARNVESIDPSRNTAEISFADSQAELLAADGWSALQQLYDRAAVLFAFEQLGGAQAALDMAVAYAQERFAFGRAIGSFQSIKHMLADMYVAMKLAESNCYYAAWALANNTTDLPLAAATARVSATQAFQHCARDNIQVHGGMGFTWEFDCHLFYRRANFLALELGSLSEWQARLVRNLPLQQSA